MSDPPADPASRDDDAAVWPTSPLAAAGHAFAWLTAGPDPVTVNGYRNYCQSGFF